MADPLTGGCFCGALAYTAERGACRTVAHCHCTMCRKLTGGSFATWVEVPAGGFAFTRGEPRLLRSSGFAERRFCGDCGCHIAFQYVGEREEIAEVVWIAAGSLDNPGGLVPTDVIFARETLPWMPDDAALPHWPGQMPWLRPGIDEAPEAS